MECLEEERRTQLSELEEFIKSSSDEVNSIINTLGWSVEMLEKEDAEIVVCPLNPEHRMPQKSLDRHLERCSLHHEGYKSDEEFLSSPGFLSSPSVVLDSNILEQILMGVSSTDDNKNRGSRQVPQVPRTSARLLTDFTAAERSAIHSHVISQTRRQTPANTITAQDLLNLPFLEDNKKSRSKSKLELLAEQRDAKRRRMNHKKVHTSRKTHTEILREVISNQMEFLVSQGLSSNLDTLKDEN